MSDKKLCLECKQEIFGRADKKYCSDYCRTTHYQKTNNASNTFIRKVNNILKKNRNVLAGLNPTGKTRVSEKKLLENGFKLDYFTNQYTTKKGITYFFCYDQGFIKMDNDFYTIFEKTEY